MKNRASFITSLAWVTALAVSGALILAFAPKPEHASQTENRMLAGFPQLSAESLLSGDFASGFESFLSDEFFGRSDIIGLSDRLLGHISLATDEDMQLLDDTEALVAQLGEESEPDDAGDDIQPEAGFTGESDDAPDASSAPEGDYRSFRLELSSGGAEEWFTFPMENIRTVADTLNVYSGLLPDEGNVYYTQVPSSKYARHWCEKQDVYSGWESDMEDALDDLTEKDVHIINAPALLEPHLRAGEELYFYHDHHWNSRGAYIVYEELMRVQGVPAVPFDEYRYRVNTNTDYTGIIDTYELLYPFAPVHSMVVSEVGQEKEIDFMMYKLNMYVGYINGTQTPWRRIETGFNTGRKALFICDSYGNALVPYMLPHYDEIHMVDLRPSYFEKEKMDNTVAELISIYGIDDIYFIFYEANNLNSATQQTFLLRNLYA